MAPRWSYLVIASVLLIGCVPDLSPFRYGVDPASPEGIDMKMSPGDGATPSDEPADLANRMDLATPRKVWQVDPAPPVPAQPMPPAPPAPSSLEILQALERGEIDVEEAQRRLGGG